MRLSKGRIFATFTMILLAYLPPVSTAQVGQRTEANSKVDLGAFVKELMVMKLDSDQTQMALWFPFEFFVEANLAEGGKGRAETERDLNFLKPFQTIFLQCKLDQPDGSGRYASEAEVRSRAYLKLEDGTELRPLDKVPPMVSATVAAMKSLLEADGGTESANMHILIFSSVKEGRPIIDASKKGKLTLVLRADKRFRPLTASWRTPFDSMSPGLFCPRCKEGVSAKWSYCPWCGAGLETKR